MRSSLNNLSSMKKLSVLLTLIFVSLSCLAQGYADYRQTTFYVGAVTPTGKWGGYSTGGVDFGIKEVFPVKKHLSLIASADLLSTRVSSTAHSDAGYTAAEGFSYKGTTHITNVPVFAHLHLGFHADRHQNFRFWMDGACGVNGRFIGKEYWQYDHDARLDAAGTALNIHEHCDIVSTFYPSFSLATQAGVGVTLFRRYTFSCVWYNLGRRRIAGENEVTSHTGTLNDGNPVELNTQLPVPETFDYGKVRTRYRTIRFGITF